MSMTNTLKMTRREMKENTDVTTMYPTHNDMSESTRTEMVDALNHRLAASADLTLAAKTAHWNVKGPQFIALHELFDQVYTAASGWTDELAERAMQLGGRANGTLQQAAKSTTQPAYPTDATTGEEHVSAMAGALGAFAGSVRKGITEAEEAGDMGTADLFTEIVREADKLTWFVEAHAQ